MNACVCILKGKWTVRIRANGVLVKDIEHDDAMSALLTAASYNVFKKKMTVGHWIP